MVSKQEEQPQELQSVRRPLAELEAGNQAPHLREAKANEPGLLDRFFMASLVASLLFDAEGVLVAANAAALRLLSVPHVSDILGRNLFDNPGWTDEQRAALSAGEVMRARAPLDFEEVRRSGAWQPLRTGTIWLDWSVSSLGTQGFFMQIQDASKEIETERALAKQERLFEEMFQAIPYPTVVWRHVGGGKFVLDRFNAAADTLSRGRLSEFIGVDMDEFQSHSPDFPARIRRVFATGGNETAESAYMLRTTGEERHFVTTAVKVGEEFVIDSADDLTELHIAKKELMEARDALQQSVEEKDRLLQEKELLLQEIHHRVKNNLAIVSSLLEMQSLTIDDERLRKMLRESQNRILSVARAHEVLYQSQDLRFVDLGRYVEILTKQLHGAFGEEGVLLKYDAASIKLPVSRAVHFGLIINELVSNAYKHAFPGSQPNARIDVSLKRANGYVELAVSDNGCGLPAEFALEGNETLGVQVVKLLAEQLEGSILCQSTQGQGSTFIVQVPVTN